MGAIRSGLPGELSQRTAEVNRPGTFPCGMDCALLVVKPLYTWPGFLIVLAGVPVYFVWRFLQRPEKHLSTGSSV